MPQDNATAPLTASTGKADSDSVWSTGLLNAVTTAGSIFTNYNQTDAQKKQAASAAANAKATNKQTATIKTYLPWVIGGVVLLAAAVFFVKRRR